MLQFINNIRISTADDIEPQPLSRQQVDLIRPLFLRLSKPYFDFKDIAKKIAGKRTFSCKGDENENTAELRFNFAATTTVSGCPVTAALADIFDTPDLSDIYSLYLLGDGKSEDQIINDIWHALFDFKDEDKLRDWAKEKLQLPDQKAQKFASIRLPQDYAALSLNAINKILPYMRLGYRYDNAVFVANLKAVLPADMYNDAELFSKIEREILEVLDDFIPDPFDKGKTKKVAVQEHLLEFYGIDLQRSARLYHPSMIETYPEAQPDKQGLLQLGSPRTSAVRNPMAMRALFRLRALINELLRQGKIDPDTKINIEFSRGLNDANRRKAFEQYQRERETENKKYADEIRKLYAEQTGCSIEPTEIDLLKYRLWEEQNHACLYTGKQIGITDFIGASSHFDIEHTVPRSRGGDDSQMNKTLCEDRFNRETKRSKIPSELPNHSDILARIESLGWKKKIDDLRYQIEIKRRQSSRNSATKEEKDRAIQDRHRRQMALDYWRGKYERFTMTEIPDGFSNRQGVDIGIIGKYARMYLRSVFKRIYTVKGATTYDFRTMWGLQNEYAKKERVNHIHHCIDAITIACIDRAAYDQWARYAILEEYRQRAEGAKPNVEKPWPTFTEDVRSVTEQLLVAHYTPDKMSKQTRRKMRKRGKIQRKNGNVLYEQGDTARGVLHQQTFYGAIKRDDELKFVVRKSLSDLRPEDLDKIVDPAVKQKIQEEIDEVGFKTAMNPEYTIWMNREKGVPIRKIRIFAPSVTQPIRLKKHRDLSDKKYKQDYHVANESNYCMAIYEGTDEKGKTKRSFKIVNNLEAAQYFKASTDKSARDGLVPLSDANDYPLRCILKTGTMVLFFENSPQELYECSTKDLAKRLYKLTVFSSMTQDTRKYGTLILRHHQEARPAGELKAKNGVWKKGEEYRPLIKLYHTQLNALVEGYDFEISITGKITFKHG